LWTSLPNWLILKKKEQTRAKSSACNIGLYQWPLTAPCNWYKRSHLQYHYWGIIVLVPFVVITIRSFPHAWVCNKSNTTCANIGARCLFFCLCFIDQCLSFCVFAFDIIALSVLRFTASDNLFGIFRLFLSLYLRSCCHLVVMTAHFPNLAPAFQ
jgi:hypothetical protein